MAVKPHYRKSPLQVETRQVSLCERAQVYYPEPHHALIAPGSSEVTVSLFKNVPAAFSIGEIKRYYPDQWVALSVLETDVDGFASKGEILAHDSDERFVWSALKLGNADDLVYVFFTGARATINVLT